MPVETGMDRIRSRANWLALVLAMVVAFTVLHFSRLKMIELGEAALGEQTAKVLGEEDGLRFTCFDATDSKVCENAYARVGRPPTIVWLGNSQNFAINRYQHGDELAVMIVHRWLKKRGAWLVSYTQPNANFFEQAVVFEAVARRYDTRLMILPVFMDKLREQGIREELAGFMQEPKTAQAIRTSPEWPELAPFLLQKNDTKAQVEQGPTIQARIEENFDAILSKYIPVWRDRSILRGNLAIALNILRNQLLGIHSYTKRPVDRGVYAEKLQTLAGILESAKKQDIQILLYIPPYRQDISGPYDDAQYSLFKRDIRNLAAEYQAHYADFTDLVPGPEWATVVDHMFGFEEPDFMHFTAEGHRRLAREIQAQLSDLGF